MATVSPVRIETERLVLEILPVEEAPALLAFFERNREHFERWDPRRPPSLYTVEHWTTRLERSHANFAKGRNMNLALRLKDDSAREVNGACNLNDVIRGSFHSCTLGFGMDHRHLRKGLMTEAVRAIVDHGFRELGLHRIQANHRSENVASAGVLRRAGFAVEGYAPDYLLIDGAWRDHVLTARTNPDWTPPAGA